MSIPSVANLSMFNGLNDNVTMGQYRNFARQNASTMYGSNGQMTPDAISGINGLGGQADSGLGWNLDTAKLALGGLQTIGNLWMANRSLKLAKDQFNFQKGVTTTNLMNSIQDYNNRLGGTERAMAQQENRSQESADQRVEEQRMTSHL